MSRFLFFGGIQQRYKYRRVAQRVLSLAMFPWKDVGVRKNDTRLLQEGEVFPKHFVACSFVGLYKYSN